MLGERISAQDALRLGIVNRVVPADELLSTAEDMARKMAALPQKTVRSNKLLVNRVYELAGFHQALAYRADPTIAGIPVTPPRNRTPTSTSREQGWEAFRPRETRLHRLWRTRRPCGWAGETARALPPKRRRGARPCATLEGVRPLHLAWRTRRPKTRWGSPRFPQSRIRAPSTLPPTDEHPIVRQRLEDREARPREVGAHQTLTPVGKRWPGSSTPVPKGDLILRAAFAMPSGSAAALVPADGFFRGTWPKEARQPLWFHRPPTWGSSGSPAPMSPGIPSQACGSAPSR
ncbi:MAG: hypothetical protein IPN07_07110 [Dehalococcoidia bacterium]|nr:hypothetical protein [Dehalococcoidia bacterium]